MFNFIQTQILFYISLVLVMFLPGCFLLLAIFGKSQKLNTLEKFIFSFGLSIVSVDFIFFAYSGLKIPITRLSVITGIILFILICFAIFNYRRFPEDMEKNKNFNFSRAQLSLIFFLVFLTFFLKTAYLSQTISPNATDLGHHMYWTNWMIENHKLPDYEGMPDFIIGEQTMFGAVGILSGLDVFSAFPAVILNLINILGILTVFVLTLRIFKEKSAAILSLLFLGVFYVISAPETKYVSGGVVGNLFGNFLMPLAFYFYVRAFEFLEDSNSKIFLSLAIFATFGLFYTHHLTAFIFLFVSAFLFIVFILANQENLKELLQKIAKTFFSPAVLATFIGGLIFFFLIFTPNYVNPEAVNTAVGAPSKATREGLSLNNILSTVGESRFSIGTVGFLILAFAYKKRRRDFGYWLIIFWALILFLLSTQPHLFFINLPSDRVGNYLSYPLAILSAYGAWYIFAGTKSTGFFSGKLVQAAFLLIFGFILIEGNYDFSLNLPAQNDYADLVQTFNASSYLAARTDSSDGIVKDHNYIAGDSWMKIFFMRGYKYPLSRGYFKRYEDTTKPREMCTLNMISNPGGDEAKQCFLDTGTNFVMVNPRFDSAQFRKLDNFSQIYVSPDIAIYYKNY